jgi:hypothetical protein
MKIIINKNWIWALAFLGLSLGSCSDFEDLNVDTNSPTAVPASNLLTQGQFTHYSRLHGRTLNAEWAMLMVQHWSQNEYAEDSRYNVDANSFDGSWSGMYANTLKEFTAAKDIINSDESVPPGIKVNQLAILEILIADVFHNLTDMWGAAPYSEAINSDFNNPSYDSQQAIYTDLLARLDDAVGQLDAGFSSFASGDVIHGGNVAAWKKTGASLLMRMAMRVSDVDNGLASQYVAKANAYGVISSNAENALFIFDAANPALSNPLWNDVNIGNRDDFAVSDVLVNTLTDLGDPRLAEFAALNNEGIYRGMPYGLTDAEAFALKSVTSRPSDRVRSADAPHVIIDRAEVAFMTAEAIERGYLSGDASAAYADGITASMNYWGTTDQTAIDNYIAANPYTGNWKEVIGLQKWIALYMNGVQAWAEWRRLDYPQLDVPAAAINPTIPVRLPYPISEDTNNGSQIDAVTNDINDLNTKMWWDVN